MFPPPFSLLGPPFPDEPEANALAAAMRAPAGAAAAAPAGAAGPPPTQQEALLAEAQRRLADAERRFTNANARVESLMAELDDFTALPLGRVRDAKMQWFTSLERERDGARADLSREVANVATLAGTAAVAAGEAAAAKRARESRPKDIVVEEELRRVEFTDFARLSSRAVLDMLEDYPQRRALEGRMPVKADLETGAPQLVLDALDDRMPKLAPPLGRGIDNKPYGQVLLGPSGSGKTRKVLDYLARDQMLGFFVPFRGPGDDFKLGSGALKRVLKAALVGIDTHTRTTAMLELERRRTLIEFAIKCVLTAFDEIERRWQLAAGPGERVPAAWTLIQLYPKKILGRDLFEHVAMALFVGCSPEHLPKLRQRACFIDEAQGITNMGPYVVSSSLGQTEPRTALSAVISGVEDALGVLPTLAGTGFSLGREYDTLVSQMGASLDRPWAYLEFPPLDREQIKAMIEARCWTDGPETLDHAARWLTGRPRFTTTLIESVLKEGSTFTAKRVLEYVEERTAPKTEFVGTPRTPGEAFAKLRSTSRLVPLPVRTREHVVQADASFRGVALPVPPDRAFDTAYDDGLHQAFLLTVGLPPQVRENVALADVDIGYIKNVLHDGAKVKIELEPLMMRAATRHIQNSRPDFTVQLVRAREGDAAAMGNAFEYVVADRVLPHLFSAGVLGKGWTQLADDSAPNEAKRLAAVAAFTGPFEELQSEYGRVAHDAATSDVYEWLAANLPSWPRGAERPGARASIFFPEQAAGPDLMAVLRRKDDPQKVVLVCKQIKLTKGGCKDGSMRKGTAREALYTVDPAKFYAESRGKPNETLVGDAEKCAAFFQALSTVPVVRVLVSGAAAVPAPRCPRTGLVAHGRAGAAIAYDLQVVIDVHTLRQDALLGRTEVEDICALKGLEVEEEGEE